MNTTATPIRRAVTLVIASMLAGACSYNPGVGLGTDENVYQALNTARYASPTSAQRWTVAEEAGRLIVQHGTACTTASRAASSSSLGIRIQEQAAIPAGFDATVFLNGWDLKYSSSDHHVQGLGTSIFNIVRVGSTLFWDAGGVLSDKNGDDGYRWCYHYTLLFYPQSTATQMEIAAHVSQAGQRLIGVSTPVAGRVDKIPGGFQTPAGAPLPRTKLLTGFASLHTSSDDQHVKQIGWDVGASALNGPQISWSSRSVLQDKGNARRTEAAQISTVLAGRSVREWAPPLVQIAKANNTLVTYGNTLRLAAKSSSRFCTAVPASGEEVTTFVIPNVPFRHAVPMLTGWDMSYSCTDHHVKRTSAAIEDFRYERAPNATTGTLFVTARTQLFDDSDGAGSEAMTGPVQLTVLGISPLSIVDTLGIGPIAGTIGTAAITSTVGTLPIAGTLTTATVR